MPVHPLCECPTCLRLTYCLFDVLHCVQVAFICIAVVVWWGKALLHIPPHFTWPFSKLLAFPHASNYLEVGAVTVLPWVAMCDRFSNLLARVVFPERVSGLCLTNAPAGACCCC